METALTVCQAEWEGWHTTQLARAAGDPDVCDVEHYRQMVAERTARLYDVYQSGRRVACYLLTAEPLPVGGREVVIVAGASIGQGLYVPVLRIVQHQAAGADSIRIHAIRPGAVRMAQRAGFEPVETVMRWKRGQQQ
ncbi:hypothetical protein SAMN02745857_03886 [Andreprevotia lacus DSM 23236]|jgi:hypothetical protein|uniref:N-acetyltransferase domain-containing protein n=1 Tax=Andreprevotia lacus DSM 23236 TaxID=1121001 RepID=A0A1W1Y062_9NEIS|nr:hypothetical protein [Andreprevotia lacus]SMC29517.1 hypothetical protein SAMN02745857_03886 [Andreprevotia lacus DSM 23236]